MTLTQLTYLVAVDTHRHFAKAAAHCFVSQPTLSVQLQKLEEELGVKLLDRSRNPVVPTDIGAQVIEQARIVLRESARVSEVVEQAGAEVRGTLHLGIIPTLAPYIVPLVLPVFSKKYPGVHLVFQERITSQVVEGLRKEELDAALIATAESETGILTKQLFEEPFVAYVAANHRLTDRQKIDVEDLSRDDMWLLKEGHCFRDQMLQVCGGGEPSCGLNRSVLFESGNLETLQKIVDRAGGMTLLPYLATLYMKKGELDKRIRFFSKPAPSRRIRLAYRRAYLKRTLIQAFEQTLFESLPPELTP